MDGSVLLSTWQAGMQEFELGKCQAGQETMPQ